jgi:hypothetical protein
MWSFSNSCWILSKVFPPKTRSRCLYVGAAAVRPLFPRSFLYAPYCTTRNQLAHDLNAPGIGSSVGPTARRTAPNRTDVGGVERDEPRRYCIDWRSVESFFEWPLQGFVKVAAGDRPVASQHRCVCLSVHALSAPAD